MSSRWCGVKIPTLARPTQKGCKAGRGPVGRPPPACGGRDLLGTIKKNDTGIARTGAGQFQQDSATPHASRVATKWLQKHSSDFRHFHWPPKSPEMNIIGDIRDALLHAVEKRSPPPRTTMALLTALQDSLCEFPPGYRQTPIESMPRRFASLLRARGGPTRY
ncbi:hypothetical protein AVEN_29835-1 [Araneus ventricosus]|uniref:Tc1-like transposase DDE domain-containing protein n=1 Tax=Araneus ventricosus TaxID=182803 RepID=A0A4Y2J9G9_ARAVE|nr:hypothetical protein AVEN_29835-1 [Araneus ventricosus]